MGALFESECCVVNRVLECCVLNRVLEWQLITEMSDQIVQLKAQVSLMHTLYPMRTLISSCPLCCWLRS